MQMIAMNWREATLCFITFGSMMVAGASASNHASFSRRHMHHQHHRKDLLGKRSACEFPKDAGLVEVTPDAKNAGWAMAPDMPCKPGMYCPYACPPGQLMAQWDPKATKYTYPDSMNGGLYCNKQGKIEKPFPDKPYCIEGAGTVSCKNTAQQSVALCQTVLPGYEDTLIPTKVDNDAVLAVPDPSYWAETSAHYYINPPGVSQEEGCVWGTKDKPVGNWSPYVAGANQDHSGKTFVTLGWNPIYLEPATPFRDVIPDWGVRIKCEGNCEGLPCEINPSLHKVNEIKRAKEHAAGAGGANFCVVGAPKGSKATIEVFTKSGSSGSVKVGTKGDDKNESGQQDDEGAKPKVKQVESSSTSSTTTSSSSTSSSKTSTTTESSSTTESSASSEATTTSATETTPYPHKFLASASSAPAPSQNGTMTKPQAPTGPSSAPAESETKSAASLLTASPLALCLVVMIASFL